MSKKYWIIRAVVGRQAYYLCDNGRSRSHPYVWRFGRGGQMGVMRFRTVEEATQVHRRHLKVKDTPSEVALVEEQTKYIITASSGIGDYWLVKDGNKFRWQRSSAGEANVHHFASRGAAERALAHYPGVKHAEGSISDVKVIVG